jgi:ATP-dependent Lhr-like helicase
MRNSPLSGEVVTVSAADPLNLVGILVPGERVPAISGRSLGYRDGVAQAGLVGELSARQESAAG